MSARIVLARDLGPDPDWNTIRLAFGRRMVTRGNIAVRLSPSEFQCAAVLIAGSVHGHMTSMPDILDLLYGDHADGGPLTARRTVDVFLRNLRPKLAALGITIVNIFGHGWVTRTVDAPIIFVPRRLRSRLSPRVAPTARRAA